MIVHGAIKKPEWKQHSKVGSQLWDLEASGGWTQARISQ